MPQDRLTCQLAFVAELDALKTILRQTLTADGRRQENVAEHSWHVAMMAVILAEYAPPQADPMRAAVMLMLHDVVEIDAGDTFIHDQAGNATKSVREQAAADRIYGLLPPDQARYYRAVWDEFEAAATPTAGFAHALDRLQPIINNVRTGGRMWQKNHVTAARVWPLVDRIAAGCPALGDYARQLVSDAVARNFLPDPSCP